METKYFDELNVGDRFTTLRRTVTETDIVNFVALAGWYEPLFMDMEYVTEKTIFGKRITPAPLTLAIAMGLFLRSNLISESAVALLGLQAKFPNPVMAGDTIGAEIEVISKKETSKPGRGVIDLKYIVRNQKAETVAEIIQTAMLKCKSTA